ncbi:general amidase-like protein GmdB [Trematosphaeria pertusa]|uniref:General amidase-like protein GmdB n=1 Tax=Trematosphaeria pertusa TaxID=390896 RepID=A0A6A6IMV5_9PLEO|nr:general amidase-like protein GmdB [Trematosphaeria pertusa]KAF2251569.1 general amidase-like protein GmdB [Trematosphaeria pertusa]
MVGVVQVQSIPKGTREFEEKRAAISRAFSEKVPKEYSLPEDLITNPPTDVSKIPSTCGILTPGELEITENYDAVGLAEAIANQTYTAVAVATAFAKRAIIAHQLTCCLTQWYMKEAIEQAKQLDEYLAKNGKTIGPLHGVPGTYSSQGCFSSTVKDEKDSQMVAILRSLGAVFYCKTNQPQSIMHLETTGHYGRTLNPFNITLSAGGSTGGEAALIAMKGSVLGVGTDIGGSIRGPSAFCGIYGFKPTTYTLPMKDFLPTPFSAELNVLCSTGPMCRSLRDMNLFMSGIVGAKPHLLDPRLIPIPWTGLQTPVSKPLKVGIINNDGFIEPQPPVKRAIAWAKERLSDPKYVEFLQIKDFKPYAAAEAWSKIRRMYWPDGGKMTKDAITSSGEPVLPLTEWIMKDAEPLGMLTAEDVNQARRGRDNFRCAFAESWQEQDVDVVIGPAFVGPACAHETAFYWTYTSLYNFVDYPGAVFPTPIKAEAKEEYAAGYVPLSDACKHVKELWEVSNFEGAPIDLQINARKYHDNELFGALELLKGVLNLG